VPRWFSFASTLLICVLTVEIWVPSEYAISLGASPRAKHSNTSRSLGVAPITSAKRWRTFALQTLFRGKCTCTFCLQGLMDNASTTSPVICWIEKKRVSPSASTCRLSAFHLFLNSTLLGKTESLDFINPYSLSCVVEQFTILIAGGGIVVELIEPINGVLMFE